MVVVDRVSFVGVHLDEVGGGQPCQTRRELAGLINDGGRPAGHRAVAQPGVAGSAPSRSLCVAKIGEDDEDGASAAESLTDPW